MYKDLSLKEKSELFKLMVSNGITDINEIEKIYNKYDNGGNKISVNNLPESEQYAVTISDKNNIEDSSYIKRILQAAKNNLTLNLDVQKERFYNHFDPYIPYTNENIKRAVELFVGGPEFAKKEHYKRQDIKPKIFRDGYLEGAADTLNDAIWATYLGIPKEKRRYNSQLEKSEYKPTKSPEYNKYYKLPLLEDTKKDLIQQSRKLKFGENEVNDILFGYNMGYSTIGRGLDYNKGEYVSYADTWDINPLHGAFANNNYKDIPIINKLFYNKGKDIFRGITNPIPFYDRIYLDDYYNVNSAPKNGDYYGGYLPEITVTNNKNNPYKYGGAINKYDGTSTKTQQMQTVEKPAFFEGDTWKPQYWFSPEYENATLKGAITQAYEDGNYGKDIIWNGRAYKAILNEEDANEYRKKKGITLGEPIVNTTNIQTNEKQPREYVSNSYIPVTSGNKIYYWDSYSGKFFEDAKGKTPTSKDYNTLLKDYYDQNISPALKENRYEDLIKLYVQQFRNLQARRRVSAREQDIPNDYGKRTITITTGKSGSSRLPYPTDLIDSLSNHLQEGQSIYQALALPYKETEFGNRVNFESDVMGNRGHVLATLNDERYELPDQTFYSGLSYPLRSYFRNNKVDGKVDGMAQENFVKHYLASSENDLLDLKNLFNNKELLKYVGETLKKDLTKSRFVSFMNTNTKDNPNIYEHALSLLASGKYNPGEPGYNKGINKIAKQLENDPELNNYIDKHKIKKVGEKKK